MRSGPLAPDINYELPAVIGVLPRNLTTVITLGHRQPTKLFCEYRIGRSVAALHQGAQDRMTWLEDPPP